MPLELPHPYSGLRAALATMHDKEHAIVPPFARHLRVAVSVTPNINTDEFGTFTGEVARQGSMISNAIRKAKLAVEESGIRLGLGSEGSFGPHPAFFLLPADHEVIAIYDSALGITIVESATTLKTNFGHIDVTNLDSAAEFLSSSKFPTHALVMTSAAEQAALPIFKGIRDLASLDQAMQCLQSEMPHRPVRITTDMRAHMNPTRMSVIRAVATRIALRTKTLCPNCGCPGFGEIGKERGVPCQWCCEPTLLVRTLVLGCPQCRYENIPNPRSPPQADPRHCLNCNP